MYVLFAGYNDLVGPQMKECLDKVKIVKSKLDHAPVLTDEKSIITFMRTQFDRTDIGDNYWSFFKGLISHKDAIKKDIEENEKKLLEKIVATRKRSLTEKANLLRKII